MEIPISDVTDEAIQPIAEHLFQYTVGFVGLRSDKGREERPYQCGAATCVAIDGRKFFLTADHVIDAIETYACVGIVSNVQIQRYVIHTSTLNYPFRRREASGVSGPDLGLIEIPVATAVQLEATTRVFYNLNKRRQQLLDSRPGSNEGVWCLCGFPSEKTAEERPLGDWHHMVLRTYGFCGVTTLEKEWTSNEFDYLEVHAGCGMNEAMPSDYRGMSGGGLWQVLLERSSTGQLTAKDYLLSGVIFAQSGVSEDGRILRGHGVRSIYAQLLEGHDLGPTP